MSEVGVVHKMTDSTDLRERTKKDGLIYESEKHGLIYIRSKFLDVNAIDVYILIVDVNDIITV